MNKAILDALSASPELQVLRERKVFRRMDYYKPYDKQVEFHHTKCPERLLSAGNQMGKTFSGSMELAYHATGQYPGWWQGHRFDKPIRGWYCGESSLLLRDKIQTTLFGDVGSLGTGSIPKECIVKVTRGVGPVKELIDKAYIRHVSGGVSVIGSRSYEQDRTKFQSETLDVIWLDEEPPYDIYMECFARMFASGGILFLTFTPLKGMSQIAERFFKDQTPMRKVIMMSIDDCGHMDAERKAYILENLPEHEIECRAYGIPSLGTGRVFDVSEKTILVEPFDIPSHWYWIGGIDFGYGHPTALAWCVQDRDTDAFYVVGEYKQAKELPEIHTARANSYQRGIPWAWPKDGLSADKGSGEALIGQYRQLGLNALSAPANGAKDSHGIGSMAKGSASKRQDVRVSLEASVMALNSYMRRGQFKVFSTCRAWLEEFRYYHRDEDGKIVPKNDDLISASRYAWLDRAEGSRLKAKEDRYSGRKHGRGGSAMSR